VGELITGTAVRRVGVVPARNNPEAGELAQKIIAWLRRRGVEALDESALGELPDGPGLADHVDAIVTLGGDGLILVAARRWPGVPLLGINFGHLGFLAAAEHGDWRPALERLLAGAGHYSLREESTLDVEVRRDGECVARGWAANDVVLRVVDGIMDVELYVDDSFVNIYPGDGIIVSTVIGSTAYNLSAGGPVLANGVKGFVITPMLCASPIHLSLVVGENSAIDLVSTRAPAGYKLITDGQVRAVLTGGEEIRVRRSAVLCRLIIFREMNLFARMASKLNYMSRPGWTPTRVRETESPSTPSRQEHRDERREPLGERAHEGPRG
jgi:NAD+ kinase